MKLENIIEGIKRRSELKILEFKESIDINSKLGKEKIIKGCIGLYNSNGGALVVGVKDNGDIKGVDDRTANELSTENVNRLISEFVFPHFEVELYSVCLEEKDIIIISVPNGVKIPACVKKQLIGERSPILSNGQIYVRSYANSNVISTCLLKSQDLAALMETCFQNNEYIFSDFVKRNFTKNQIHDLVSLFSETENTSNPPRTIFPNKHLTFSRFIQQSKDAGIETIGKSICSFSLKFPKTIDPMPTTFRRLLDVNPNENPIPLFNNSFELKDENSHPKFNNHYRWFESFYWNNETTFFSNKYVEFWTIHESGEFNHCRMLEDDVEDKSKHNCKTLEPGLLTLKVAEFYIICNEFAKHFGMQNQDISLGIEITGTANRILDNWGERSTHRMLGFKKCLVDTISIQQTDTFPMSIDKMKSSTREQIDNILDYFDNFKMNDHYFSAVCEYVNAFKLR